MACATIFIGLVGGLVPSEKAIHCSLRFRCIHMTFCLLWPRRLPSSIGDARTTASLATGWCGTLSRARFFSGSMLTRRTLEREALVEVGAMMPCTSGSIGLSHSYRGSRRELLGNETRVLW